jgi:hypothetical protein
MESEEVLENMSGTEETKEEQMMEGIVQFLVNCFADPRFRRGGGRS